MLELSAANDPFFLFTDWFTEASASEVNDPDAAALATVSGDGQPNVRMVLVKQVDAAGFIFFTNSRSAKGSELTANPKAALCFHWKSLQRQIRVRGAVEKVADSLSDDYFNSRHPISRRGAIASQQSTPLASRATLDAQMNAMAAEHPDDASIPRPPHWYGFRIVPAEIEFWQQGDNRLHDRFLFKRLKDGWDVERLYP